MQELDVTKYDGKWYEVMHSSDNVVETGWECVTESYTKLDDGTDNYLIHTPFRRMGKYHEWAKGQEMVCPDGTGACVVNFHGPPDKSDSKNYNIVATDLDSYTIVYSCFEMVEFYYDIVWIMTREPTPSVDKFDEIRHALENSLSFYDFDKDFHKTFQGGDCDYDKQIFEND